MDDAYPGEGDEARRLVESCADCAALAADVKLISGAMSRLPRPTTTRSFAITPEQAEKLRGTRLSRWLRVLAAPGWTTLRPVAGVALSIGLVMAAVGVAMPNVFPAAGSGTDLSTQTNSPRVAAPVPQSTPAAAPETSKPETNPGPPEATMDGMGPVVVELTSPAPGAKGDEPGSALAAATENPATRDLNEAYTQPSPATAAAGGQGGPIAELAQSIQSDPTRDVLLFGGLAIAALSVALLALAWFARRYFADPLLR
jgi:hypothetical protein